MLSSYLFSLIFDLSNNYDRIGVIILTYLHRRYIVRFRCCFFYIPGISYTLYWKYMLRTTFVDTQLQ